MNETSSPKVNKEAKNLLGHLFYDKIIQLESDLKENISFSKQTDISTLKIRVETFIERNPYADFEVRILEKGAEDNESYKLALLFKNYKNKTDKKPSRFLIVIDSAFNTVNYYQWALNNVLLPI